MVLVDKKRLPPFSLLAKSVQSLSSHFRMLKVTNLSKAFGNHILFDGVSFGLHKKEKVGIIGRNGYGKSTLLNIIADKEQPDSGQIAIPKDYRICGLEQHLHFTEATILQEACLGLPIEAKDDIWKAEMILSGLGFLPTDLVRAPEEFSGGYQIRVKLAKLLLSEPDLLLLDEPTNYLDIVSLRWLERFLQKWSGEFLLVTHDRSFMDAVTTHTMMIHRQKIKKIRGSVGDMLAQIAQEEQVYEQTRIAAEKKKAKSEQFIRQFRAGARSAGLVQSRIKMLSKLETGEALEKIPEIRFHFEDIPYYGGVMLSAHSLGYWYDSHLPLINKLDLSIYPGDRIGIIGRNGAGKTTLLRLLADKIQPLSGTIKRKGNVEWGLFEQTNIQTLNPNKTIVEELLESNAATSEQQIRNLCAALLFRGDEVFKPISVLSGGEKSRVSLGKLMLSPTHLLFLDEPTNHLDMESCDALCKALEDFGGAVVFVSHNEDLLSRLANKLVVFDGEQVKTYELPYQTFLEEIGWQSEAEEKLSAKQTVSPTTKKIDHQSRKEMQKRLRFVEKQISRLENKLEELESENETNTLELQKVALENDHVRMAKFGDKASELTDMINAAYRELGEFLDEQQRLQSEMED